MYRNSEIIAIYIYRTDLLNVLPESIKCMELLLTIPITSVSNERSFWTLNRIISYLKCTMVQDRLSRISIEKKWRLMENYILGLLMSLPLNHVY
ncbi:hypothetical protein A3Q56_05015 [Intoshia linei]|uniref:HAT C-terminal dimerisation domain-containing protein n=1 Tax=Intoshia linei TaxID=1819745 RepID=A0A177AZ27_9BILA|nr:hypothetical protein A3Q56_05015 [Intoshia linei]